MAWPCAGPQAKLIPEFKKLGGIAKLDKKSGNIISLTLNSDKVSDAGAGAAGHPTGLVQLAINSPKK